MIFLLEVEVEVGEEGDLVADPTLKLCGDMLLAPTGDLSSLTVATNDSWPALFLILGLELDGVPRSIETLVLPLGIGTAILTGASPLT